ncbi:MAG: hypothetical protein ACXVFK_12430 [Solirubrobacteraceae bacterium]
MRLLSRITLVLGCLAALVAAGCGGGSSSKPSPEVTKLLADTFGANKPVTSGRLDVHLNVDATGFASLKGPLDVRFSGPFQSQGTGKMPKFDFDVVLARDGSTLRAGAVSTGDRGYLKLLGKAYQLDPKAFASLQKSGQQAAATADRKNAGISLRKLGIDPRRWLQDAKQAGTEQVGGTETVHLTAGVKVGPMLSDLNTLLSKSSTLSGTAAAAGQNVPTSLDPATRTKIEKSVKQADLDVWTGKADHALRRIRVAVRFDVPASQRAKGSPPQKGTVALDLTIAALNQRQAIGAPASPRPIGELSAALAQVAAQFQSQAQGSAPAASGQPKYDQCVAAAGTDIVKAQQCASLLGQ